MTDAIPALSAVRQRALIRAGELSAREAVEAHLARIDAVNPAVNAIVTLDGDAALERAGALDEAQARGEELGILHGLVVAHKDLLPTRGMRTTWGSRSLADTIPEHSAHLAVRMAEAGAVAVGKTNVPEFGLGSHTVNAVFGATRNPYDLSRSAGGSSGGAAAALATGMVALADGGDMGGSLRNPASFCNVVGLRPPAGRVTSAPTTTSWPTMAVLGPMGRSVADTALLHSVIAGFDPADAVSLPGDGSEYLRIAEEQPWADLRGIRVGWSPDLGALPVEPAVRDVLERQGARVLEALGADVAPWHVDLAGADHAFRTIRAWSVAGALGPLFARDPEALGENARVNIEAGRAVTAEELHRAVLEQDAVRRRVLAAMDDVDVVALPAAQLPPFPVEWAWPHEIDGVRQGDYLEWMRICWYITVTGLPALSVPCGFTADGLPIGLQLVGRPLGEESLLRIARVFEAAAGAASVRPALLAEK